MAYYNANEIVRLTRLAVGISQEELCDGICDVSTLSRMENGHHAVKRDTYKKLMAKMGRKIEMRYADCIDKEGKLLERRLEMERAFNRYDYEAAGKAFQYMKENADDNVLTSQYIMRAEAWTKYYSKQCTIEEVMESIDKAIRLTVPNYEQFIEAKKVFPFMLEELLAIMNLGSVYRKMGQREQGKKLYMTVLCCLNANYIGDIDKVSMQIAVRNNLARIYYETGFCIDSLNEIEACIFMCVKNNYCYRMSGLLLLRAHLLRQLAAKGEYGEDALEQGKKALRQAYYLAAARADTKAKEKVKELYRKYI